MSNEHIMILTPERRRFLSPIPRLRIGSTLLTRGGVLFRVREAVVMVAQSGGESPSLVVDRIREGRADPAHVHRLVSTHTYKRSLRSSEGA
jgi:hypothetical protein